MTSASNLTMDSLFFAAEKSGPIASHGLRIAPRKD